MENRRIEYRSVPDFPKYIVSNLGSVISMDYNHTGESREISQGTQGAGYKFVVLCNNGVRGCSLSITKSKRVAKCNSNMEIIEEFNSVLEAKALTGINNSKIGECCNGKRRSAGG